MYILFIRNSLTIQKIHNENKTGTNCTITMKLKFNDLHLTYNQFNNNLFAPKKLSRLTINQLIFIGIIYLFKSNQETAVHK